ncbi:MAG: UvrB/UvrC motif-containing protein [Flavobacteriales bacterium]|nr:UvrB/UvrC motif-containing protein [Flavobacteriales bacterium]
MKTIYIFLISIIIFNSSLYSQSSLTLEELNTQKNQAVANEQYRLAKVIQDEINKRNSSSYNPDAEEWRKNPETVIAINKLEAEKKEAVTKEYWTIAAQLKKDIDSKKGLNAIVASQNNLAIASATNKRDFAYQQLKKEGFGTTISLPSSNTTTTSTTNAVAGPAKVKDATDNSTASVKYRRSSLYTLMVNDPTRQHANVIKDAFGNAPLPEKFNDHNIGPYLIEGVGTVKDRSYEISNYLNNNFVAKDLVAKWFNRKNNGVFNMDLIASRGEYDASTYDKLIAASSQRGDALLADAGEDLIGNTFVIVNDFKFTSKEEIAQTTKKVTAGLRTGLSFIPGAGALSSTINNVTAVTDAGVTVAGKGYIIKTTSYLYRLEWNDSVAAVFYQNYWADETNLDPNKVKAFDISNLFRLKYIGSQDAWADVQSSIFTNKSEEDLIKMATVKATDQAIAKLQRKFEEFRTKTPLHSVEPLTAKIGLKEGLEPGDKFEVLESVIGLDGKISYKRKGIITVKKGMIWDNSYVPDELKGNVPPQAIDATHFNGASGQFYPGMLIKQIN